MQVGGYTLDLYCDIQECRKYSTYYSQTGSQCKKDARLDGWKLTKKRDLCPKHSGKTIKSIPDSSEYTSVL